jgi:hypothetical protein
MKKLAIGGIKDAKKSRRDVSNNNDDDNNDLTYHLRQSILSLLQHGKTGRRKLVIVSVIIIVVANIIIALTLNTTSLTSNLQRPQESNQPRPKPSNSTTPTESPSSPSAPSSLPPPSLPSPSKEEASKGNENGNTLPQKTNPMTPPTIDRFGTSELYPTALGGTEWTSKWDYGAARTLVNTIDPNDNWFDVTHGNNDTYTIDGKGTLTASGDSVRMYVHDPANSRQWSENLEITLYFKRISETSIVDYSGLQVFARTNHGTNGDEDINLCDDRGYGGLVNIVSGEWAFEKESAHQLDNGYTDVAVVRPTKGQIPTNEWIGFKYIVRNMDNNTKVKLELYRDMTNGTNGGGSWQKVTEFVDDGTNFGVGDHGSCNPAGAVNPALPLIHSMIDNSSESKKPMLSVYVRHEDGTMQYSRFSVREISPLS